METINVIRMLFSKLFNPLTPSVHHRIKTNLVITTTQIYGFEDKLLFESTFFSIYNQ